MLKYLLLCINTILLSFNIYSQISIQSKFSGIAKAGGKGELEVQINRSSINSFAKYQLEVPPGVLVSDIDVKGGNFLMENGKAKVVWVSLPKETPFTILLKLSFQDNVNFPITLYQRFYFLENSVKKEIQADPLNITPSETSIAQVNVNKQENNNISVNVNKTEASDSKDKQPISSTNEKKQSQPEIKKEEVKPITDNSNPSTANNITYKIQISAGTSKPNENQFSNIGKVEVIQHNGLYKVMIDKVFHSKEEALQYRDQIVQKGYTGAFLVKYVDGKRVN